MTRAVVFAYHDVGVRCLKVLLARGVEVPLVVTHEDAPGEAIWFESVAATARDYGIPAITPEDPNDAGTLARVAACAPDFLFSFYYRRMLGPALLAAAPRGAFNMHGSMLPRYRGRVPVNWAVLRGETETGATLHAMTAKPDAGHVVDQQAVPILPDDTAGEVFRKVAVAAEITLHRCLPGLIDGSASLRPQDLAQGSYFGGRRPEDGRIDWTRDAVEVHDLVRAVAPPYPGAFTTIGARTLRVLRTLPEPPLPGARAPRSARPPDAPPRSTPELLARDGRLLARCGDARLLRLLAAELDGEPLDAARFAREFGASLLLPG